MSFINRTRQLTRKCEFCECNGHNISECNDERLTGLNQTLSAKKSELDNVTTDITRKREYLKSWVDYNFDSSLIKAYAIKFCGASQRSTNNQYINKIIKSIWTTNEDTDIEEEFIELPPPEQPFQIFNEPELTGVLDIQMVMFLSSLRNNPEQTSEKRKYNITATTNTHEQLLLENEAECCICYEETIKNKNMVTLNCGHEFCNVCVRQILEKCNVQKKPGCAVCRREIRNLTMNDVTSYDSLKDKLN